MVLAALKMALVICIPLVLMFSTYDLKATITVSVVQFAIIFVDFWLQIARWIDTTILDALYGVSSPHSTLNPLMGMNNTQADMLLNYVMAALFIVLPTFWVGALSFAGFRVGNSIDGLRQASKGAEDAGASGASVVQRLSSKGKG
jgi:hypothetical protein